MDGHISEFHTLFRTGNFNQGDSTGYQRPHRNYQNRNSRWNQNQTNRDRQWNSYNSNNFNKNNYKNGYNTNGYRSNGRGQLPIEPPTNTEGSKLAADDSGQSRPTYNSNNSKRKFNSSGTAGVSCITFKRMTKIFHSQPRTTHRMFRNMERSFDIALFVSKDDAGKINKIINRHRIHLFIYSTRVSTTAINKETKRHNSH